MRVAVFGGTGYVGSYMIDALLQAGMHPVLLVRPGHETRVRHRRVCEVVSGDLRDTGAVDRVLSGADAAIYNVGILREFPERGITFRELHQDAAWDGCNGRGVAVQNGVYLAELVVRFDDGTQVRHLRKVAVVR